MFVSSYRHTMYVSLIILNEDAGNEALNPYKTNIIICEMYYCFEMCFRAKNRIYMHFFFHFHSMQTMQIGHVIVEYEYFHLKMEIICVMNLSIAASIVCQNDLDWISLPNFPRGNAVLWCMGWWKAEHCGFSVIVLRRMKQLAAISMASFVKADIVYLIACS